jgi:large subunit ribosomal protein L10
LLTSTRKILDNPPKLALKVENAISSSVSSVGRVIKGEKMLLTKERKNEVLSELKSLFEVSSASIASNYSGLKANELTELRKAMAGKGIRLIVTKNSLVKKALEEVKLEIDQTILDNPVIFAFGSDEVETAKVLSQFAKEHEALKILGGIVQGESSDQAKIKVLSLLPSREELQGKLVGILAAPTYGLVNVLHGNIRGLVSVLSQYKSKLNN